MNRKLKDLKEGATYTCRLSGHRVLVVKRKGCGELIGLYHNPVTGRHEEMELHDYLLDG